MSLTPVPNFTKETKQNVDPAFFTPLVLEDSKTTLLIHTPILRLHDIDQNHRWKLARIQFRLQLGPQRTLDTDPLHLRMQDLKGDMPKSHNLDVFNVSKASPINKVALYHLGHILIHMQFSAQ